MARSLQHVFGVSGRDAEIIGDFHSHQTFFHLFPFTRLLFCRNSTLLFGVLRKRWRRVLEKEEVGFTMPAG